jgi:peptide chain release factor subunit 1
MVAFLQRVTLKNHSTGEEKILFLSSEQEKDKTHFTDQVGSIPFW